MCDYPKVPCMCLTLRTTFAQTRQLHDTFGCTEQLYYALHAVVMASPALRITMS